MVSLLEVIGQIAGFLTAKSDEDKARNAIAVIESINDLSILEAFLSTVPAGTAALPVVQGAITARRAQIEKGDGNILFDSLPRALFDGFKGLAGEIDQAVAAAFTEAMKPGSPDIKHAFEAITDTVLETYLDAIDVEGKGVTPAVKKQVKDAISPVITLGLTFTVASVLGELIHPTKNMGLGQVSHFLYDTVGFKSLMEAYTEPLKRNMISAPVEKAINAATQPFLPNQGELTGLARKHEITKDQYRDAMRKWGVQEKFIDALLTGFWADPRLFEIIRIMDVALPPAEVPSDARAWLEKAGLDQYAGRDWWLAMKFAKAGYDEIDIPVLMKVVRKRYLQSELGNIRTLQRQMFKAGRISRSEYERSLADRGVNPEESKDLLDNIEDERKYEEREDLAKAWEAKYSAGKIDAEQLTTALTDLEKQPDYITRRIEILDLKRSAKLTSAEKEKELTTAQITKAYRVGLLSSAEAIRRLGVQGWEVADATILIKSEDGDLVQDENTEWIRAAEQQARNLRLSAPELTAAYLEHGKTEGWAAARTAYMTELIRGKE